MIKNKITIFILLSLFLHTIIILSINLKLNTKNIFNRNILFVELYKVDKNRILNKNQLSHPIPLKIKKGSVYLDQAENKFAKAHQITTIDQQPERKLTTLKSDQIKVEPQLHTNYADTSIIKRDPTAPTKTPNLSEIKQTNNSETSALEEKDLNTFKKISTYSEIKKSNTKNIETFDKEVYQRYILSSLRDHLGYPYLARKRGIEGDVIIIVTISTNGKLEEIKLLQSSGYNILDDHTTSFAAKLTFDIHPPERVSFPLKISYRLNR